MCCYAAEPAKDTERYVLWRGERCFAVFNRFPYSNGHLLIAPLEHRAALDELDDATLSELIRMVRDAQRLLREAVCAQGFNVGMNLGRCAGAGLPGHLHIHVVPRWEGDTNFMSVLGETRVISQSMEELLAHVRQVSVRLNLPTVRG